MMKRLFLVVFFIIFPVIFNTYAQEDLGEIQVIGHEETHGLSDFFPSVTKLKGQELVKKRQTTVADTLSKEAGVSSTSFGPNSSRPVIRGLDGPRIRILQNGLGVLDASTQSLDHNIPIDPMLVDQIEIVRGPMGLLYGSSAVGGVVNIVTNRTHSEYTEGAMGELSLQGETVNNGVSSAMRADYGKNNWMLHVDGATKNLQNQKIPGYARSTHEREVNPLGSGEVEATKKVPNSFNKQNTLGVGVSRFFSSGHLGASFSNFENTYGTVAEKDVSINMLQNRFELDGEMKFDGILKRIEFRSAQSNYRHKEIEHETTGTIFKNDGNESRLDLFTESGKIKGVTGIQTQIFNFKALGDEAFLPANENAMASIFSVQKYSIGKNLISFGGRIETTKIKKKSSDTFGEARNFGYTNLGASIGNIYTISKPLSLNINYSYTERSPNFQELLSNGPHLATGTFELGNSHLIKEKSHSIEFGPKLEYSRSKYQLNFYTQKFNDFISLNPSSNTDATSGLPIYTYSQAQGALFYGSEYDGKTFLKDVGGVELNLLSRFDFVTGKNLKTGHHLPRLSPPRVLVGFEVQNDRFSTDIEGQYVFKQTNTAPSEQTTPGYFLTNLGCKYSFVNQKSRIDLFTQIRNIFDVEARSHVSTLKEISPLPGRNIVVGVNWLL